MVNEDRPRGILSEADRKYLQMDSVERQEEYSRPGRHKRKEAIRERTKRAVLDLPILYQNLHKNERSEIFDPLVETMLPWAPVNLLTDAFGLLLLGFLEQTNRDLDDEAYYERVFERTILQVLYTGVHMGADVDVDVTIDGWAPLDDLTAHEDLSELRPSMLRSLLMAGEITDEEFAEAILAQQDGQD